MYTHLQIGCLLSALSLSLDVITYACYMLYRTYLKIAYCSRRGSLGCEFKRRFLRVFFSVLLQYVLPYCSQDSHLCVSDRGPRRARCRAPGTFTHNLASSVVCGSKLDVVFLVLCIPAYQQLFRKAQGMIWATKSPSGNENKKLLYVVAIVKPKN